MDTFIGFVYTSAFNFSPADYAFCRGQLLAVAQNTALFSLIGSYYGGDARTTMGLPDLRARAPVGSSQMGLPLPPLRSVAMGQHVGLQTTLLSVTQLPSHTHLASFTPVSDSADLQISTAGGTETAGTYYYLANGSAGLAPVKGFVKPADAGTTVSAGGISSIGGWGNVDVGSSGASAPVSILNPCLGMSYVIALEGVYPARN